MKYSVVYSSKTGNTALLAKRLKQILPQEDLIYFGSADDSAIEADIIFVGSWTDKGNCSTEIIEFLKKLENKQVYLFGTAGFGGSEEYFRQLGERMAQNLSPKNILLGYYLCQGKMPKSVRSRYEILAQTQPEKANPMIENFDKALSHPDDEDLKRFENEVKSVLTNNLAV